MKIIYKPIDQVSADDFEQYPVWEFTNDEAEDRDETWVTPVDSLPVSSLSNRVLGTKVRLHNGTLIPAMLGNVSLRNSVNTSLFLTVSIFHNGAWFHLARYFDFDYTRHGPEQLAAFLGFSTDEVFPIAYDISDLAVGDPNVVVGIITAEPAERLDEDQIMELVIRSDE